MLVIIGQAPDLFFEGRWNFMCVCVCSLIWLKKLNQTSNLVSKTEKDTIMFGILYYQKIFGTRYHIQNAMHIVKFYLNVG